MSEEYCNICGETTGRAGIGDDSIYLDECGPLCESCRDKIIEAVRLDYLPSNNRIEQLEAENSKLKAQLQEIESEFRKRLELVFTCFKPTDEKEAEKLSLPQRIALELIQEIKHGGGK